MGSAAVLVWTISAYDTLPYLALIRLQRTHTRMRHIARQSGRSDQQQRKEASDQECRAEIRLAADCAPAARTRQGATEKPPNHPINPKEGICDSG